MICANCGRKARKLAPCPCGLGDECPYESGFGVCDHCYRMIVAHAIDRSHEQTHTSSTGLTHAVQVIHQQFTAYASSDPQPVDENMTA